MYPCKHPFRSNLVLYICMWLDPDDRVGIMKTLMLPLVKIGQNSIGQNSTRLSLSYSNCFVKLHWFH